jgi:hypothetical protein
MTLGYSIYEAGERLSAPRFALEWLIKFNLDFHNSCPRWGFLDEIESYFQTFPKYENLSAAN